MKEYPPERRALVYNLIAKKSAKYHLGEFFPQFFLRDLADLGGLWSSWSFHFFREKRKNEDVSEAEERNKKRKQFLAECPIFQVRGSYVGAILRQFFARVFQGEANDFNFDLLCVYYEAFSAFGSGSVYRAYKLFGKLRYLIRQNMSHWLHQYLLPVSQMGRIFSLLVLTDKKTQKRVAKKPLVFLPK